VGGAGQGKIPPDPREMPELRVPERGVACPCILQRMGSARWIFNGMRW
jgi:hypothetical protein